MLRARTNGLGYGGAPAGSVESARRPRKIVGGKPYGRELGESMQRFIPRSCRDFVSPVQKSIPTNVPKVLEPPF